MEPFSYSEKESRKVAEQLLSLVVPHPNRATVIGLTGDLGAGKTTLTQQIAAALGVQDTVQSPTFVIAKFYKTTAGNFSRLAHLDAYRIDSSDELSPLGWEGILAQPNTLVVVEWPERIEGSLPHDTHHFSIAHDGEQRIIRHGKS